MRFLVDAQLPPLLARRLRELGHPAEHVQDAGLLQAPDAAIWEYAAGQGAVILTKDEDFAVLAGLRSEGPQVAWIRVGNTTKPELWQWLEPLLQSLVLALERGERLVELV